MEGGESAGRRAGYGGTFLAEVAELEERLIQTQKRDQREGTREGKWQLTLKDMQGSSR